MSKLELKIIVLLGIIFTMGLPQMAEATEPKPDKIPVPDNGFTIVLRSPMGGHPQLVKVYRIDGNNTEEVIPGLTVWLPRDTPVFFMIDDVQTDIYSVKITVKDKKSTKPIAGTKDTEVRFLEGEIKYTCVITPLKEQDGLDKEPFEVILKQTKSELYGAKATLGPFLTDLKDESYVNIKNKIALGSRDQLDRSLGVLVHAPIYSRAFEKIRFAFALSGGLSLGELTTSDGALSIGPVPATLGVSLLFAGPNTDSLLSISGGTILKPVKRLNGYSVGDDYPSDPEALKNLTKRVDRFSWFVAVTFSYDILDKLGFKSVSPSAD